MQDVGDENEPLVNKAQAHSRKVFIYFFFGGGGSFFFPVVSFTHTPPPGKPSLLIPVAITWTLLFWFTPFKRAMAKARVKSMKQPTSNETKNNSGVLFLDWFSPSYFGNTHSVHACQRQTWRREEDVEETEGGYIEDSTYF